MNGRWAFVPVASIYPYYYILQGATHYSVTICAFPPKGVQTVALRSARIAGFPAMLKFVLWRRGRRLELAFFRRLRFRASVLEEDSLFQDSALNDNHERSEKAGRKLIASLLSM
jgi:hypothetical protein